MPSNRAGRFVRQPSGYDAFVPASFPPTDLAIDDQLLVELGRADRSLARLDGAASVLPDVDHFISMYIFQEAALSSQIEGTQATLLEALEVDESAPPPSPGEGRDDVHEILNYVRAMGLGLDRLTDLPLSIRLVREIHESLMTGVRGGETLRAPGEIRKTQNWIGGTSPANARFVPPPIDEMWSALGDWEKALHDDSLPPLIHIALLHAQFETIHPFLDGNGRVGRLLVTFLLTEREILARPLLYLSIFFKTHRDEYYARLQATRDEGDWESWLRFFVTGVHEVARSATSTVQAILELRERDRSKLSDLGGRSGNALRLHEQLFSRPVVRSRAVQESLGISQPTADTLLGTLEDIGILREWTGRRRDRSWIYSDYTDLFTRGES